MESYELIPFGLSIEDIYKLSRESCDIKLSLELKEKSKKNREFCETILKNERINYNKILFKDENFLSPEEIRAIMILLAYNLSLGYSIVRMEVIEKILEFLRKDIIPLIPERIIPKKDFNPLIFIVYTLLGKGEVLYKNNRIKTEKALKYSNTKPINLYKKEILALTSGTQYISGIFSLYYVKIKELGKISEIAIALSLEALNIDSNFLNPLVQALKPHLGLIKLYENLRKLLSESEIIFSYKNSKFQDLSLLDHISQGFFIFHQTIDFIKNILEIEINSISNSPLIIPEENFLLNENLHIETLIPAIDYLSIVITGLTCLLEKITLKIQSVFNLNLSSLYNICQRLVKENKKLSKPLSDNIPYLNRKDLLKMEVKSILRLKKLVKNWQKIITINLIHGIQGIDYYKPLKCGRGTEIVYQFVKSLIFPIEGDKNLEKNQILEENLNKLLNHVEEEIGELY